LRQLRLQLLLLQEPAGAGRAFRRDRRTRSYGPTGRNRTNRPHWAARNRRGRNRSDRPARGYWPDRPTRRNWIDWPNRTSRRTRPDWPGRPDGAGRGAGHTGAGRRAWTDWTNWNRRDRTTR